MPSILDDLNAPAKILLIGKPGSGKTGSLASLVAAGYNLRIIDTDKGVRRLRSLLTDAEHYPYAKLIEEKGIDINHAVRYVPIDTSMRLQTVTVRKPDGKITSEKLLAPTTARAWTEIVDLLSDWKESDGFALGPISSWGLNDVLVLDSFSTLSRCAYYYSQALNQRLGAREEGNDYRRDVGAAQSQLTRLLELTYDSDIGCNIIIISHITWVDDSQGVASRPRTSEDNTSGGMTTFTSSEGYPSAIGRALSPQIGKYFNDMYIARSEGSGGAVRRTVSTVPQDGISAKNSVYLEREYPINSALAEIFFALKGQAFPSELRDALRGASASRSATPPASSSFKPKSAVSA